MRRRSWTAIFCLFGLSSCTADYYAKDAEKEATSILQTLQREHIEKRQETVTQPQPIPAKLDPELEAAEKLVDAPQQAQVYKLREVMKVAVDKNRDYQTQRENIYLAALSLSLARYNFGPKFNSTISYLFAGATGAQNTGTANANLGGTTILPTGGNVSVNASTELTGEDGAGMDSNRQNVSTITSSLNQPLWRGGGYEVSHEALTQAERNAVYGIRSFEIFREDFAIQVLTRFYSLVTQKRVLDNQRQNLEQFVYLRRRSEALFQVGRAPQIDVLRARQQELSAQDSLLQSEEQYQSALAQFKIFLGLPTETKIDISSESPDFNPIRMEEAGAIEAALKNRLDLLTSRERLEDAERAVRISSNGLSPDLNLTISQTSTTNASNQFAGEPFENQSWNAGVSLGLPLDRKAERNAYSASLIERTRRQRSYQLDYDNIVEEVRATLRRLRRAENAVEIQKMIIDSESKRLKIAEIRFRAGEIGNRDVVEAQQGLLSAQNSYIEDLVNYAIAKVQLKRDLGTLFLDNDGMPLE